MKIKLKGYTYKGKQAKLVAKLIAACHSEEMVHQLFFFEGQEPILNLAAETVDDYFLTCIPSTRAGFDHYVYETYIAMGDFKGLKKYLKQILAEKSADYLHKQAKYYMKKYC